MTLDGRAGRVYPDGIADRAVSLTRTERKELGQEEGGRM